MSLDEERQLEYQDSSYSSNTDSEQFLFELYKEKVLKNSNVFMVVF